MKAYLVVAAMLALGCPHRTPAVRVVDDHAADAVDVPLPTPDAPAHRAAVDTVPGDGGVRTVLASMADGIAGEVSRLRGLSIERPIARGVMSRSAIVTRMRDRVREEYPPGEVQLEGALYKRLGLIPEGMDYERTMFDLLEEQVAGFYDPDTRRLYIADWLPPAAQPITMAHEITHALQDQHFDIARYTHHVRGQGDAQTAAMSVVEGDATVAMFDYQVSQAGQRVFSLPRSLGDSLRTALTAGAAGDSAGQPRLAAAPRALREALLFPYLQGFAMCLRRVQTDHAYTAVDALLQHPPESTEQVMHPEKLDAREAPVAVPAVPPQPLADAWSVAYDDVMGELGIQQFLEGSVPDTLADTAAAGWGGDRAVLLAPRAGVSTNGDGGTTVTREALAQDAMVWTVVMDTDADANEFAAAARTTVLHGHAVDPVVPVVGVDIARGEAHGRVALVAHRGRTVLVADRLPGEHAAAVVHWALTRRL